MIDKDLLAILCCPETRQDVSLADDAVIRRVNEAIQAGTQRDRSGRVVSDAIESGLVRADGKVLYPVRGGIPIMLVDEALLLS